MQLRSPLLWLFLLSAAYAQILLNPPKEPSVISVDVDLVNILCSVRDNHGGYVKGLQQGDFEIKEDGRRQTVTHFAREVDSPLTVALLLDVSGSVQMVLGDEKQAAVRFFSEVLRPNDKALLAGFAQLIAVWQDLTPSVDKLQKALEDAAPFDTRDDRHLETRPRGGTLLYDAIDLVATQKMTRLPGRKTMILITDGEDNGSISSLDKAMKSAQAADVVIYGIHYEDHSLRNGLGALKRLSEPTGGRAFHVDGKMTLEKVFAEIGEEMRNQYGLGFTPQSRKDGEQHRLEVKMVKSGLKVQARTAYFRR